MPLRLQKLAGSDGQRRIMAHLLLLIYNTELYLFDENPAGQQWTFKAVFCDKIPAEPRRDYTAAHYDFCATAITTLIHSANNISQLKAYAAMRLRKRLPPRCTPAWITRAST